MHLRAPKFSGGAYPQLPPHPYPQETQVVELICPPPQHTVLVLPTTLNFVLMAAE